MAMTLRLDDEEDDVLGRLAQIEGRSKHEIMRRALHEYAENHSRAELLDRVLDSELPRYAEALRRLGE